MKNAAYGACRVYRKIPVAKQGLSSTGQVLTSDMQDDIVSQVKADLEACRNGTWTGKGLGLVKPDETISIEEYTKRLQDHLAVLDGDDDQPADTGPSPLTPGAVEAALNVLDEQDCDRLIQPSTECSGCKPTNPKDSIGSTKLPIGLVPQTGIAYEALAFMEGGLKYGAHNWRVMGVRGSVYFDACQRHLFKWWNGEESDPETGVPHLASARACLNIILDARVMGKLTDDRPPACPDLVEFMDRICREKMAHLKELHKDKDPKHWTIKDV
jgi:hypothetical protein